MEHLISDTVDFIRHFFQNEFSGHDYFHSMRVYQMARHLAEQEGADVTLVSLAALLHDVDDRKLSPETHENKENAVAFLRQEGLEENLIQQICTMIEEVSFNGSDSVKPSTLEGQCVQDADRLDALGAVGIARAFAYGGSHHREIYNPQEPPMLNMDGELYQNHVSTSVNHFYEKLFLLKGLMNTSSAREAAEKREMFMRKYLEEFLMEWDGKDLEK